MLAMKVSDSRNSPHSGKQSYQLHAPPLIYIQWLYLDILNHLLVISINLLFFSGPTSSDDGIPLYAVIVGKRK